MPCTVVSAGNSTESKTKIPVFVGASTLGVGKEVMDDIEAQISTLCNTLESGHCRGGGEGGRVGAAVLNRVVREGRPEKVMLEQRLEVGERGACRYPGQEHARQREKRVQRP